MWTTALVITLYSIVWCIPGHIQWFMQHNFLFPKVTSPSQCASLWCDVRHARAFRTFQTWNTLWRSASRVAKFIQNVTNIFIFYLTQSFRPATSSGHLQSDEIPDSKITHRKTAANQVCAQTQLSKVWLKTCKRFYSDGKCPLDGTWCQRHNCQFSYKGGNYARGNRQKIRIPRHSQAYQRELPDYDVALCTLTKFPRNPRDCACSQHHFTELFFPLEVHSALTVWK